MFTYANFTDLSLHYWFLSVPLHHRSKIEEELGLRAGGKARRGLSTIARCFREHTGRIPAKMNSFIPDLPGIGDRVRGCSSYILATERRSASLISRRTFGSVIATGSSNTGIDLEDGAAGEPAEPAERRFLDLLDAVFLLDAPVAFPETPIVKEGSGGLPSTRGNSSCGGAASHRAACAADPALGRYLVWGLGRQPSIAKEGSGGLPSTSGISSCGGTACRRVASAADPALGRDLAGGLDW